MKRILVATDLSPRSKHVLTRAIGLAAAERAEIRIVHALTGAEAKNTFTSTAARMMSDARRMAEALSDRPLKISGRVGFHKAEEAILKEAEAWNADIIVLGAHGEPHFRDALFGTTGTYVVRHSDRPVLIVQNDAGEPYAKVLIAVDDAAFARPILDAALAVAPDAELFAIHAFYPSLRQSMSGVKALDEEEKRQEAELERLLAEATAGRPSAWRTAHKHGVAATGEALEVIRHETEEILPNLVAMGTRARATYLGSHAVDTLFWCYADILVVPEHAAAEVVA